MGVLGRVKIVSEDEFRSDSNKWCAWFLYIALITFFGTLV